MLFTHSETGPVEMRKFLGPLHFTPPGPLPAPINNFSDNNVLSLWIPIENNQERTRTFPWLEFNERATQVVEVEIEAEADSLR